MGAGGGGCIIYDQAGRAASDRHREVESESRRNRSGAIRERPRHAAFHFVSLDVAWFHAGGPSAFSLNADGGIGKES